MPETDPILRLDRLNKRYLNLHVLKDFSLDIGSGEFVTLLGPSGCGKSTTLSIVAGLTEADSGEMLLRGKSATNLAPQKRRLGMVFQSWALFPHMTVFENVAYGLRMQGRPDAAEVRRKVGAALELVRLGHADAKFPSQLSGGMQQRVALARALVTGPDLLLLDEPLSNLDAALRKEMQVEIKHIHETLKVSTLLVTHSQEEALVMSDRIAVMRAGRIERIARPYEIYTDPHTAFVCTFVGDANVLTATVDGRSGDTLRLTAGGAGLFAPAHPAWEGRDRVTLALRPESIAIAAPASPHSRANRWTGRIVDQIFKGGTVSYEVAVGGTMRLQVLALPAGRGAGLLARGDEVALDFAPEEVIALSDVPEAA